MLYIAIELLWWPGDARSQGFTSHVIDLWPVSISRCRLTCIGISILKIRWSHDHLIFLTLQWRHNGLDSVSNHQPHHFYSAQIKENIKAPRHWPLCGEFTGDPWIPRTNGQLRGKCFHSMTSSWMEIPISGKAVFILKRGPGYHSYPRLYTEEVNYMRVSLLNSLIWNDICIALCSYIDKNLK